MRTMIGKISIPLGSGATSGPVPNLAAPVKWLKEHRVLSVIIALLLIAAVAGATIAMRATTTAAYLTAPVVQQDLTQTVTASGTLNAQNTVNVGTQASGTISEIDVDYNSKVKKGQVLARIDPTQMQAQLDQARASLAQAQAQAGAQAANATGAQSGVTVAQAGIQTAQANVTKAQSSLAVAQLTVARDKALFAQGYIARSQYDADSSNAVAAQSALAGAQAATVQASAQTAQSSAQAVGSQYTAQAQSAAAQAAQAQVAQVQYNLQHSVITSPVDGTVIARSVSVGQTVAASLQTPTLFTIAQNLQKMEVDIAVGEPDIGNLHAGEKVDFSVLAYPNQTFHGVVSQVRVNPTTVSNVVTYDVVTLVNNPQNQLLPGMTANASIDVATAHNALVVPTQALSWRPASGSSTRRSHRTATPSSGQSAPSGQSPASSGSPWGQTGAGVTLSATPGAGGVIFVQRGNQLQAVRVKVDLVSGTQAAVTPNRGTINAGDVVIIGDASQNAARSQRGSSAAGLSGPGAAGSGGGAGGIGRAIR